MTHTNSILQKNKHAWHSERLEEIFAALGTNESGLSVEEAKQRLAQNGPNALPEIKEDGFLKIFFNQFRSPLIYVLLIATLIVVLLGELTDGAIILFVLLVNSLVGTYQEDKARKTLKSLKDFSKGRAVVFRDNLEEEVNDEDLVVGDIIILQSGDKVPADARLINTSSLKVDESALTGESVAVEKDVNLIAEKTLMPDRKNMLYQSTLVVAGEARAVVIAIGVETEIGQISEKLAHIPSEIPLKQKITELSRAIGIFIFLAVALIFLIGLSRGMELREVFFASTAIAVSLIPEGLPVVITLILARGVHRMAKRNALVKNMQAVEALGQADVIAVDKTGTITKNELMVERVYVDGKDFAISGSGFEPKGEVSINGMVVDSANHPEILIAGKTAAFTSSASVRFLEDGGIEIVGDPTEAALLTFGKKVGFNQNDLEAEEPKILEEPFSYERRFHLTLHKLKNNFLISVAGEPESILSKVSRVWSSIGERPITNQDRNIINDKIKDFSANGLRIIAFAINNVQSAMVDAQNLPPLAFVGLYGLTDVLREEVVEAVDIARANGLKPVMITGDHLGTAEAIAKKAHIFNEGDSVISGAEIAAMHDKGLPPNFATATVFGRVLPEHKLLIVEAYKKHGQIIGMTGDGVNDALSLRAAHLGIAMGRGGTDVAKEAADIILLDNNFKSIIAAVEEGRSIYATIKKVVLYLVSTGVGEFLTIAGALLIGLPLPIFPNQILWLNLVTDGFLVVALAFEPNMKIDQTRRSGAAIFDKERMVRALIMGGVMMIGSLWVFNRSLGMSEPEAWTMSLTVLAVFQWFNAWNCRSRKQSAFYKPFSNPYLVAGLSAAVLCHLFALYNPFMQTLLHTTPLSLSQWGLVIAVSFSVVIVEEIRKIFVRRKN